MRARRADHMRMMLLYALLFGFAAPQSATIGEAPAIQYAMDEQVLAYGDDPLQQLLFWRSESDNAPLIVFVHGGGWSRGDMRTGLAEGTREHWQAQGLAVASLNYRLVPDATVEDQAADIASALAMLTREAPTLGFDSNRIVLVGHSAGAHLAALVASDPQYLAAEGLTVENLRGVVALDGAGYDVPAQMQSARRFARNMYSAAFGDDRARQDNLSPITHVAAPNAQSFLILHVDRRSAREQSSAFAQALSDAGTQARVERVAGRGMRGHREINQRLGDPDYPATSIVDAWLAEALR